MSARAALLFVCALLSVGLSAFAQDPTPPTTHKPLIVLVGDSTVTDTSGWGLGFKRFLNNNAQCINTAANGRSSRSFINEGRWKNALLSKAITISSNSATTMSMAKDLTARPMPATITYHALSMARYVDDARSIGAKPILVTSLIRRQWDRIRQRQNQFHARSVCRSRQKTRCRKKRPFESISHVRSERSFPSVWENKSASELSPVKGTRSSGQHSSQRKRQRHLRSARSRGIGESRPRIRVLLPRTYPRLNLHSPKSLMSTTMGQKETAEAARH